MEAHKYDVKMPEYDRRLLEWSRKEAKEGTGCLGCRKLSSKACGTTVYVPLSSSSGQYQKKPDFRCTRGI